MNLQTQMSRRLAAVRLMIGTIGPKPGVQRLRKMLLTPEDMTGRGWEVIHEYAFRSGSGRQPTEEIRRARKVGSITASRCLQNKVINRSLLSYVIPYASEVDAQSSLPSLVSRIIRRPDSKLTMTGQQIVDGLGVPGVSRTLFYEERFVGPEGPGGTRIIAGTIGEILFIIDFSAVGELWTWDEAIDLATVGARKIRAIADSDSRSERS